MDPLLGDIKAVVGFELGYGKNMEARLSLWHPRAIKEGKEVLNSLVDRDICVQSEHLDHTNICSRSDHQMDPPSTPVRHYIFSLNCYATSEVTNFDSE